MNNKKQLSESKLPSPCVSVCQMDPVNEICLGCFRTLREIASWPSMNKAEQLILLRILGERRIAATRVKRRRLASEGRSGALSF